MGKKRSNLANSLMKHRMEEEERRMKKRKMINKEAYYPDFNKKKGSKKRIEEVNKNKNKNKKGQDEGKGEGEGENEGASEKVAEVETVNEKTAFLPFSLKDRILIIGDGDFSYSLSLVMNKMILAKNLVCTSFDSREELNEKYGKEVIDKNILELNQLGVDKIYHKIDGTKIKESLGLNYSKNKRQGDGSGKSFKKLGGLRINNIIFNFPHVGLKIDNVDRNVLANQKLLTGFFKSCIEFYDMLDRQRELHRDLEEPKNDKGDKERDAEGDEDDDDFGVDSEGNVVYKYSKFANVTEESKERKISITLFEGEPYDSWKVKRMAKESISYCVERSGKFEWQLFKGYKHRRTAGLGDTNKAANTRMARTYKFCQFHSRSNRVHRS